MDDVVRRYLALLFVIMAIVALVALVWWPGENTNIAMLVVGVLTTNVTTIINFFFGSSEGSQNKTKIIKDLTEQSEKKIVQEEKEEIREEVADKKDELKREVFTEKDHEKREEFTEKEVENLKGDKS